MWQYEIEHAFNTPCDITLTLQLCLLPKCKPQLGSHLQGCTPNFEKKKQNTEPEIYRLWNNIFLFTHVKWSYNNQMHSSYNCVLIHLPLDLPFWSCFCLSVLHLLDSTSLLLISRSDIPLGYLVSYRDDNYSKRAVCWKY